MPYLTNVEENEHKHQKTTTDEGVLGDEELRAAKGTRSSSFGYWGCTGTFQHVYKKSWTASTQRLLTSRRVSREPASTFGARPVLMAELQRDLHLYVAASSGFTMDHGDVGDFTAGILTWWKNHATEVGAWSEAAKISFAMVPNSAGAERVLSMLKTLFGSNQDSALADFIRGSMFLHYNNSKRASEAANA